MVLQNYVILSPNTPTRMHFTHHEIFGKTITDPSTRQPKTVNSLQFTVDELNGQRVNAYYSTISDKHARDFAPYLAGDRYVRYDFVVTQVGEGFRREYQVQVLARV